ncbi:MAG: UDP-N-acetylmuramoyl-L-alanine--D-glutamate ligase [Lentimicrobiaceae bacterium]|jgi:UDP-N-acetylmuramoylalanine--D-glutamate ligase|nr:UDP-N-acetylmuramoyl-L-alanine--D-glutamate ligase [Lentimicrobiaceae bacterium]MBT3818397.1 UDP-N-acetylmuramoyl-L-alanine--D-glutamate ligase [Lentimicrobiaceae bacterium]MBT4060765.1 UDP-N-acetylmuramoyl-L-alanine--D-glutamate ligase [Lentimicrobiaceae bacterium]MBT4190438.1 UDP-N-acetylmuramoyl-L-alanine--D-glutamate ligase [Lentimicrobiaceae bacterium]MBT5668924.1 UDP-N-acetylmuramoyl-L-alanine--D-glutamate ligase [Lentimicrobiaceae bacterium]
MNTHYQIVVLGAGESGVGAAILAKKNRISVFVSDNGRISNNYKDVLINNEIDFEELGHSEEIIMQAQEVIKSPGIPDDIPIVRILAKNEIPIISEIEFAARYTNAKLIMITGSNGKTTTTLLIFHLLKTAGLNVGVAGNLGESFAKQVANYDYDYYVLEISSFQLDGMFNTKANIAVLLNITPDHLDRYDFNFKRYAESKFKIFQNQSKEDALIFNIDDEIIASRISEGNIPSQLYPISLKENNINQGAYLNNNEIEIIDNKTSINMTLEQLALQGKHNVYNSMAAGVAAKLMDIRKETLKQCLSDFHNVAHRLEYVSSVHGIRFINDSKATNVNATWYALEYYEKPIIWIAGGQDKGNDYSILMDIVKSKVKAIVCLGENNVPIHDAFGNIVDIIVDTNNTLDAVRKAYELASKDDVVLLSPSCASFDLFENYEDRGNQFKIAVKEL